MFDKFSQSSRRQYCLTNAMLDNNTSTITYSRFRAYIRFRLYIHPIYDRFRADLSWSMEYLKLCLDFVESKRNKNKQIQKEPEELKN